MKTEWMNLPKNWKEMPVHTLAQKSEFDELLGEMMGTYMGDVGYDDNEPIIVRREEGEDRLLDGRHRRYGAIKAGLSPTCKRHMGTLQEAAFLVAKKSFRQHFTTSQRAHYAAQMVAQNCFTQEEAAEKMKVSKRSVQNAAVVVEGGTKALNKAVKDGKVSVSDAAKIAELDPKGQNRAVKAVMDGKATTVVAYIWPICERCKELDGAIPDCTGCEAAHQRIVSGKKLPPVEPNQYLDDNGLVVPARLNEVFKAARLFRRAELQFNAAALTCKTIENLELLKASKPLEGKKHYGELFGQLRNARYRMRAMRPAIICPGCGPEGDGCDACHDLGWITAEMAAKLEVPK